MNRKVHWFKSKTSFWITHSLFTLFWFIAIFSGSEMTVGSFIGALIGAFLTSFMYTCTIGWFGYLMICMAFYEVEDTTKEVCETWTGTKALWAEAEAAVESKEKRRLDIIRLKSKAGSSLTCKELRFVARRKALEEEYSEAIAWLKEE